VASVAAADPNEPSAYAPATTRGLAACSAPQVEISVLVPVRNEESCIREVVKAMQVQEVDATVEFLLLDGGSTDSTPAVLTQLVETDARFRLIEKPGTNIPQRLNLGVRLARGGLIARMDAHTIFPPNYLQDGIDRLGSGDVAWVSGPAIAVGDSETWSRQIALALRSRFVRGDAQYRHVSPAEIDVESGFCGICQRSLLTEHGGWNEEAANAEDLELAARIRRAGGRIVCVPAMTAAYLPRKTLVALAFQYRRHAYYRVWAAAHHPDVLHPLHLLPPIIAMTGIMAALAPTPAARLARRGLGLYAVALVAESARVGRGGSRRDVVTLPAVFATIHFAWGAGFLAGCLRFGLPWTSLRHQLHETAFDAASPGAARRPGGSARVRKIRRRGRSSLS
jgi:succinoglycan biosynthesis protein ExoA